MHSCRSNGRGAGLSMYIKDELKIINHSIYSTKLNYIHTTIDLTNGNQMDIIGLYRPPHDSNMNEFMTICDSLLAKLNQKESLFLGDMNINASIMNRTKSKLNYMDLISSHGFNLCNTATTRRATNTVIDHVLSNVTHKYNHCTSTIEWEYSDHNILITNLSVGGEERVTTRQHKYINHNTMRQMLQSKLGDLPHTTDVNTAYDTCAFIFKQCADSATMVKTFNCKKHAKCNWLTKYPNMVKS